MASKAVFNFCLGMWIRKSVTEVQLKEKVDKGTLTQEEYELIIATPQQEL